MKPTAITVKIFGQPMGLLFYHEDEIHFRYEDSFQKTGIQPSPLCVPNDNKIHVFPRRAFNDETGLPGLFTDSLPDKFGNDLIQFYLRAHGQAIRELTPLDKLAYIGDRAMGALSYEPSILSKTQTSKELDLESIAHVCRLIKEEKQDRELTFDELSSLEDVVKTGSSIGGAKPKALIYRKGNHILNSLSAPREGYQYEIIKFSQESDGSTIDDGKIEYLYYQIAIAGKITMMPSTLLEHKGIHHFVTRRFDMDNDGNKFHTHTLAGLQNNPIWKQDSFENILKLIKKLPTLLTPQTSTEEKNQREEMFRRMLFNIIADNRDDHAKNTSFIMSKEGKWQLSPAYDLMYSYFTNPERWTNFHGKRKDITETDIIETGKMYDIHKPETILEEIRDHFISFEKKAHELDMNPDTIKTIVNKTNTIYTSLKKPPLRKACSGRM